MTAAPCSWAISSLLLSFAFLVYEKEKGLRNEDHVFELFLVCVFTINFIYFFIYHGSEFLKSCLYYVFNFICHTVLQALYV